MSVRPVIPLSRDERIALRTLRYLRAAGLIADAPPRESIRIGTRCGAFGLPVAPIAPTPAPTPVPTPVPTPDLGTFGAGTFVVGTGVAPGTYAAGGASCYWARLSGFGGTVDEIIANNFGDGAQIVTIAPTDAGFTSSNCGTWRLLY